MTSARNTRCGGGVVICGVCVCVCVWVGCMAVYCGGGRVEGGVGIIICWEKIENKNERPFDLTLYKRAEKNYFIATIQKIMKKTVETTLLLFRYRQCVMRVSCVLSAVYGAPFPC